ncbi:MAG: hypothetical protein QNK37_04155 [Acidobacteriota bacterium]|nr:hypothetical protein [Acidobacteriota bacterium]
MLRKVKALFFSVSMAGILTFGIAAFLTPAPAQAAVNCVPICDPGPCLCTNSSYPCVRWVAPGGGPCISPQILPQCNPVCIGGQ